MMESLKPNFLFGKIFVLLISNKAGNGPSRRQPYGSKYLWDGADSDVQRKCILAQFLVRFIK